MVWRNDYSTAVSCRLGAHSKMASMSGQVPANQYTGFILLYEGAILKNSSSDKIVWDSSSCSLISMEEESIQQRGHNRK